MMGIALLCLSPYFLYQTFVPHPFGVTAYSASVDYEFRDKETAFEFALLNRDAQWVKVDGTEITPDIWRSLDEDESPGRSY